MKWQSRIDIPSQAQLANRRRHPNWRMRKRTWVVIISVVLALLLFSGLAGSLLDSIIFYAHVARLYTETPESRIAMPLANVRKQQIADTWHAPRGTNRLHEGQDIFAAKGTPVLSATPGYVYNIGENNLGGQTVSVIGRGGRVYYYAHLDAYASQLHEGDWVTTRTVLGYVGTTGNAQGTPPHLHFGVYASSGAINPLPLLSDRLQPPSAAENTQKPKARQPLVSRKA
jgi:murein DD-endopeptidase MepM/ murein hydrolase activator NlpD